MLNFLFVGFSLLLTLAAAPVLSQNLSTDDQERVTIMQNAIKLRLPVTDLEVMFKYAFAMNKPALTLAGLEALSELPDQPVMMTFTKDIAIKNADCKIAANAIGAIGQMGLRSGPEARKQAALNLNELNKAVDEKSLACVKAQPAQTEAINSALAAAVQKLL